SPENNATFLPGSDIVITAEAADTDGTVTQVDFYSNGALIGSSTKAPYTVTITKAIAIGDYTLTAKATDDLGASTFSNPVVVKVADVTADVAIVRNFDDPEVAAMEAYLFELGLTYYVFDQVSVTFEAIKNFKLIIWDDLGQLAGGLRNKDVDVFQQAYDAQIPIYFIGERLASSTSNLTEPAQSQWTKLIHLQPSTTTGGNGTVTIITDSNHRVINGRFGFVADFAYPARVDQTSQTGSSQYLLGQSGNADVLIANEDTSTAERSVSQNVLMVNGSSDAQ